MYPHFGDVPVAAVDTAHVLAALQPIWRRKTETATRIRSRIEVILDAEKVRGHRTGENPARWGGHLKQILPAAGKIAPVEHHAALPYVQMPAFFQCVQQAKGVGARALEYTALTVGRTGMTLGAMWSEVDLEEGIWTVPAERMKGKREFRMPLSKPALTLIRKMADLRVSEDPNLFIFPGATSSGMLSNNTMLKVLERLGRPEVTTHGFRSTFKDWASECTSFPPPKYQRLPWRTQSTTRLRQPIDAATFSENAAI